MIIGVGIDILDVARMKRELEETGSGFRDRVFAVGEIAYCEGKRYPARHYAARFAAKEALFKALGNGLSDGLSWQDVEVRRGATGAPGLVLSGRTRRLAAERGVSETFLSLTHTAELAMATVVLQGRMNIEAG